ncbi:hypothetical protein TWF730_001701 [Orbilia blumenaviensis]|uniref:Uncharacterized protein n=1 Tax=Orbilia blumenaviensis TaxID=1796055 RepID=A0AAV9UIN8_9PEZI
MPCKSSLPPPEYARDNTPKWVWDLIMRRRLDYEEFVKTPTFIQWERSIYEGRMSRARAGIPAA